MNESAYFSIPKFNKLYLKLKRHIEISGKSKRTLSNYTKYWCWI